MMWNGKDLKTIGDIMNTILAFKTKREAQRFMAVYRKHTPSADINVGYMSVYYGEEEARRIMDWCEVVHPFFGNNTAPSVSEVNDVAKRVEKQYRESKMITGMVKQPEHSPVAEPFGQRVLDL